MSQARQYVEPGCDAAGAAAECAEPPTDRPTESSLRKLGSVRRASCRSNGIVASPRGPHHAFSRNETSTTPHMRAHTRTRAHTHTPHPRTHPRTHARTRTHTTRKNSKKDQNVDENARINCAVLLSELQLILPYVMEAVSAVLALSFHRLKLSVESFAYLRDSVGAGLAH